VFLIAFMYLMPMGIAGALQMVWARAQPAPISAPRVNACPEK
jgi:hypothetical protein